MTPFKVLFVCMGNICRSPAGENIFRKLVVESGRDGRVTCDSAGTINYHAGKGPDPRMRATLEGRGIPVTGRARQFTPRDFAAFDLIVTMDDANLANVLALAADDADRTKVRRLVEFCEEHEEREVPDPYYGGDTGFELVADLLDDGCRGLLGHVASRIT